MRVRSMRALVVAFEADRRGNVAAFFAMALIPILGVIGMGVDYGNANRVRSKLQTSLDTAALAAASSVIGRDDNLTPMVRAFLIENFTARNGLPEPSVVATANDEGKVTASAKVDVPTSFMALLAFDKITVSVTTEAAPGIRSDRDTAAGGSRPQDGVKSKEAQVAAERIIEELKAARASLAGAGGGAIVERAFDDAIRSMEDEAAAAAAAATAADGAGDPQETSGARLTR